VKLGITLDNLGASQLAYFTIKEVNKLVDEGEHDIILFYENLQKICLNPRCTIMQINECWGYDGVVIATNLRQAARLISFPGPINKFYYCWDLDWLRPFVNKEFYGLHQIYSSSDLQFIARSEDHAKALEKCWNIKVKGIVSNINMKEMLTCLK
jgi:hypothetical protein